MLNNRFKNEINIWLIFSLVATFLVILPISSIWYAALDVDSRVWNHIYKYLFLGFSINTLILVLGVALLTTILGVTAAWLIAFENFYFRKILSYLLIFPIAIPPYAVAYCYADITDKGGLLSNFMELVNISQFDIFVPSVRSITGVIFVLSITLFPYVYLITRYSFEFNSRKIIEAATNLGISNKKLFFKCSLPLARPAIIAGLALVIMETMSDFGVVHYLGVDSLSVGIYKSWFGLGDFNSSARLATILFIFAFFTLFLENLLRNKKEEKYFSYSKDFSEINTYRKKSLTAFLIILFLTSITLFIPIMWLISNAFSAIFENITILGLFLKESLNSIMLALSGSILIIIIAAIICFTQRIYGGPLNFFLNMAKVGYASPGIVIAIGVITPIMYFDRAINKLFLNFNYDVGLIVSGSLFVLVFAYLTRFLAVAFNPIEAAYQKVNRKIDSAASNLGANNNTLFFKIHIPMLASSFLIGFLLVFIDILKELPATLILRPFNFNTLSILTFEYASSEQLQMAAIPALIITILAIIPLTLVHLILKIKR